jgi:hypothetical protein
MLLKNAYLRPGTYFTTKCYHCGTEVTIQSDNGQIMLRVDKIPEEYLSDDDENDIVTLRL